MIIETYACYNNNKKILNRSSSGGVFYALASSIIKKYKGVVYGCVITNGNVFHKRASKLEELLPMLGSKYVRSNLDNTFAQCKEDLKKGKYVLYSGTPCQINALHFYLDRNGVNKGRLIGVDTICHGTPKPLYWKRYLDINFKDKDISNISFRYKKEGWENYYIKIGEYESPYYEDPYMQAFLSNKILCESCFKCECKGENRKADITLGDFWGVDSVDFRLKNKNGTSAIIIRNRKELLLKEIRKTCVVKKVPYMELLCDNWLYFGCAVKPKITRVDDNDFLIHFNYFRKDDYANTSYLGHIKWILKATIHNLSYRKTYLYHNKKKRKMNGRIGILTELGYTNYGNRLQNYALLFFIKQIGKKPVNICYTPKERIGLYCFLRKHRNYQDYYKIDSIYNASVKYEGKFFCFSKNKYKQKRLCNFETIIVGGDQVWNPSYHPYKNNLEIFLGNFGVVNKPFKLISYSASICVQNFTDEQKNIFGHLLKQFDKITVREKSSCELLSTIGVESKCAIDPVFLVSKNDWDKAIESYSKYQLPDSNYHFICVFNDDGYSGYGNNAAIVKCYGKNSDNAAINQFDFVNIIKNSSLVVTDSYHAVLFSIMYKKKIVLLKRNLYEMEIRFDSLFSSLGVELEYDKEIDFSLINCNVIDNWISFSKSYLIKELTK